MVEQLNGQEQWISLTQSGREQQFGNGAAKVWKTVVLPNDPPRHQDINVGDTPIEVMVVELQNEKKRHKESMMVAAAPCCCFATSRSMLHEHFTNVSPSTVSFILIRVGRQ
jgi:hypothetical protein